MTSRAGPVTRSVRRSKEGRLHYLTRHTKVVFVGLLLILCHAAVAAGRITYSVMPDFQTKQFRIEMTIPRLREDKISVQIPTWSPGAYMAGNYAANIKDVTAETDGGSSLAVEHPDSITWSVTPGSAKSVKVRYSVTGGDIQPNRAHISGPRTYMYVVGRKEEPVELSLIFDNDPGKWPNVATSLDRVVPQPLRDLGPIYRAPNYDTLADAPIEMGDFWEESFTVKGVPHQVVLYGSYANTDKAKLVDYSKRCAEAITSFFGDVPFKRYVFMYRSAGTNSGGAGGLEHLGSTEIGLRGLIEDRVRSVIAHEYFHAWNVKRIRPAVLGPFDYTKVPQTRNLWWSEGVTSYYGDLLSRRYGLNTDLEYFKHLADTITTLQHNPARLKVSADESSLRVVEANNSQGYGGLSYYNKGELVGLCLDLRIREVTHGRKSLDDVMKGLYAQCGKGNKSGFGEDDIKKRVNRVAGQDLSAFYDRCVRSTEELPLTECLAAAGVTAFPTDYPVLRPFLGMDMRPSRTGTGITVSNVAENGPAAKAGLQSRDVITAVDGKPADTAAAARLRDAKTRDTFVLTVQRSGQTLDIPIEVGSELRRPWVVAPAEKATPEQLRLREGWLNGKS
jgi:predicted metalloprotease with PDZ domain